MTSENKEKDNRIQLLSSTNDKMKQTYNALIRRMEQLQKNINKKTTENYIPPTKKKVKKKEAPKNETEQTLKIIVIKKILQKI